MAVLWSVTPSEADRTSLVALANGIPFHAQQLVGVDGFSEPSGPVAEKVAAERWLRSQIESCVRQFCAVSQEPQCRVHLMVTNADECTQFHVDHVRLRLLATFVGPGTLWYRPSDVVYGASPVLSINATAPFQVLHGAEPQQLAEGEILLMKCGRYPGQQGRGIVHRSPAIRRDGAQRLVLRIDTPEACGC